MEKKITLHDYLLWIAEDESNINGELIQNELMLQMDVEDAMNFYNKYKDRELLHFNEKYYEGEYYEYSCNDTTISFYIEGMENGYFEIPNVTGSFLHDNGFIAQLNNKEKMFNEMIEVFSAYLVDIFTPQAIKKCVTYIKENMQDYLKSS